MKRIPIAVQLYSVRRNLLRDMPGTLKKLAAIGYKGVEFYGGFLWSAEELRAALDAAGLACVGWHISYESVSPANVYATIAYAKAVGMKTLCVAGVPSEMADSPEACRETAAKFAAAARTLSEHGIHLGYHNHGGDFKPFGNGETAWSIFMENTPKAFFGQLDNGNALSGGADVVATIKRYPGRGHTYHLKPYSLTDGYATMIGEDDIPWGAWFEEVDRQDATKWYIVEYECEEKFEEFEGVRRCLRAIEQYLG